MPSKYLGSSVPGSQEALCARTVKRVALTYAQLKRYGTAKASQKHSMTIAVKV